MRADQAAARLHRRCWNRLSAGKGAKGERDYDWAWLRITPPADEAGGQHWLLVRRSITDGVARLLPVLVAPTDHAGQPRARRRHPVVRGGVLPSSQRRGRSVG